MHRRENRLYQSRRPDPGVCGPAGGADAGGCNDWQDHTALLDYGFAAYPRRCVLAAGETVCALPVKGGTEDSVLLTAGEPLWYPMASGEEAAFPVDAPAALTAPLPEGTAVGSVSVSLDGETVGSVPLVTGEALALDAGLYRQIAK